VMGLSGYSARAFVAPTLRHSTSQIAKCHLLMIVSPNCFSTFVCRARRSSAPQMEGAVGGFCGLHEVARAHILRRVF